MEHGEERRRKQMLTRLRARPILWASKPSLVRVNLEAPESASRDKELVDERQRERKGNGLETASLFFGCLESSRFLFSASRPTLADARQGLFNVGFL